MVTRMGETTNSSGWLVVIVGVVLLSALIGWHIARASTLGILRQAGEQERQEPLDPDHGHQAGASGSPVTSGAEDRSAQVTPRTVEP